MKDLISTAQRSFDELLHGATFGPYVLRRAIPGLLLVLGAIILNAMGLIPWKFSVAAGLLACVARSLWKWHKRPRRTIAASEAAPSAPSHSASASPPPTQSQHTSVQEFVEEFPTEEIEPVQVSDPPPEVPKVVRDHHVALYDHHFHGMWLVEKLAPLAGVSVCFFGLQAVFFYLFDRFIRDNHNPNVAQMEIPGIAKLTIVLVDLFVLASVVIRASLLKQIWNTIRFVVTAESYSMPRTMPWPFPDRTPTIRVIEITYLIERNWLDKKLGTCRLEYGGDDTTKIDDEFVSVKWLKYPDELRIATGSPPVGKARWFRGKQR